ncbi:hypothetical protein NDU88_002974 [Pleurodeles waltl]|uniref:Uncharacterized protein n=1 Tax=Pleurodeles waltl TaxID=8319 RepID=A0AAV7UXP4_PLEWA|nr:hypothetical protein NDU88_002974 [Pleurodeles waltl]
MQHWGFPLASALGPHSKQGRVPKCNAATVASPVCGLRSPFCPEAVRLQDTAYRAAGHFQTPEGGCTGAPVPLVHYVLLGPPLTAEVDPRPSDGRRELRFKRAAPSAPGHAPLEKG